MYLKRRYMSKRVTLLFVVLAATLFSACSDKDSSLSPETPAVTNVPDVGSVKTGSIVVKMKEEIPQTKSISDAMSELEIYSITKLFPTDPRFEERHRKAGLHLWYHITFNPEVSLTKAAQDFSTLEGVDIIEYMPIIRSAQAPLNNPFNDPYFDYQWHYHNTAPKDGYVKGADMNLLQAWNLETGDESVIVAITDAGVDYKHEDLKDAMWINEAELHGQTGVDDDGNGYKDDIYGYNFAVAADGSSMQGTIKPEDHGTHVAGTVGAVNNNGKFGAGIAGGNGTKKGVRLMSCQTISGNSASYISAAFVYAADNGAVISQNSWSLLNATSTPQHIIDGIEYFRNNAGKDKDGNQVGPIFGGVAIFAAGNENNTVSHPSMYEGIITVAATGPSGAKSSYSNYGAWVDISAPGGENGAQPYGDVYSTIPNNEFGAMSGTSMACPHVSGVAALMVSRFGGPGYTNDMLWNKLLASADEEKLYSNEVNSRYKGFLGEGALDAFAALYEDDTNVPEAVKGLTSSVNANAMTIKWLATGADGKSTYGYNLYYSTKDLSGYSSASNDKDVQMVFVSGGVVPVGEEMSCTVAGLEFATKYFVRVESINSSNVKSALSPQIEVTTDENDAPIISPSTTVVATLKSFEVKEFKFTVVEPNNHTYTYTLTGGSSAASATIDETTGDIIVKINAPKANAGTYTSTLIVTDQYEMSSSVDIQYTILENFAPAVTAQFPNVLIQKGEEVSIDLSKYITDEDGESLVYAATSSSTSKVVEMTIAGNILNLKGNWYGATTISVTGTDSKLAKATASFDVLLRDNAVPLDIYPNPVQTTFKIRTPSAVTASVSVSSISGAVVHSAADVQIDVFNPYEIDATGWEPGNYSVEVNVNGEKTRRNIVKL